MGGGRLKNAGSQNGVFEGAKTEKYVREQLLNVINYIIGLKNNYTAMTLILSM